MAPMRSDLFYPVADDFFPPVALTEQRLTALREEATKVLNETMHCYEAYKSSRKNYLVGCAPWRLHVEHEGLRMYKRSHDVSRTTRSMQLFGTVEGSYLDIAGYFRSDTRADFFASHKQLFGTTLDAAVLYNVPQQQDEADLSSPPVAYEGIKWAAFRPSAMLSRMDMCFFEAIGSGYDMNGAPYAFRVMLPTRFPEVPDLFDSKRTMRVFHKSVMIVTPSERTANSSEMFMATQNDFHGSRLSRSVFKRYLISLHRISAAIDSKRLALRPTHVHGAEGTEPEPSSKCCGVCSRSFSLLRSKHQCGVCSQNVCRKCLCKSATSFNDDSTVGQTSQKAAMYKVCTACIKSLRGSYDSPMVTPLSTPLMTQSTRRGPCYTDATPVDWWGAFRLSETKPSQPFDEPIDLMTSNSFVGSHVDSNDLLSSVAQRETRKDSAGSHHSTSTSESSPVNMTTNISWEIQLSVSEDQEGDLEELNGSAPQSRRSTLEIDTSEMTRVRTSSSTDGGGYAIRSRIPSAVSSDGSEAFETIHWSLQEQEALLHKLMQSAYRGSRT